MTWKCIIQAIDIVNIVSIKNYEILVLQLYICKRLNLKLFF